MEIYHLALISSKNTTLDLQNLSTDISPDAPPELTKTEIQYNASRNALKTSNDGIRHLDYVMPSGEIIDIGLLNTRLENAWSLPEDWGKEDALLAVVQDLGFNDFISFARDYNSLFSHRDQQSQNMLNDNAQYVDDKFSSEHDIKIGNVNFENLRFAVQIWVTYHRIPQNDNDTVNFGKWNFPFSDLQSVIPGLQRKDAIITQAAEAEFFDALFKLAPNGNLPTFSQKFNDFEQQAIDAITSTDPSIKNLSQQDYEIILAELMKFNPLLSKARSHTLSDSGRLPSMVKPEFKQAADRMVQLIRNEHNDNNDNNDNSYSVFSLIREFCDATSEGWCSRGG